MFANGSTASDLGPVPMPPRDRPQIAAMIDTLTIATSAAAAPTIHLRDRPWTPAAAVGVVTASSACRISRADWGRRAGFFSRHCATTRAIPAGQSGRFLETGG